MKPTTSKKRSCRYWLNLLLVGLAWGVLLFVSGYVLTYVHAMTRPWPSAICCITPADHGFECKDVTFTSADGVTLSGWYIPSQNGAAVILLHGEPGNRLGMMPQAEALAKHGFGVLLYDRRAQGESGGDARSLGWLDVSDVSAALAYLQSRAEIDPERIGIMGFSLGGQIAIRAAAQMNQLKAVAADGPSLAVVQDAPPLVTFKERFLIYPGNWLIDRVWEQRFRMSAPPGVAKVLPTLAPRPILLIAAGQDEIGLRIVRHYYDVANEPKMLWKVPDTGHGDGPKVHPEEYEAKIVTFFEQALLADASFALPIRVHS